MKILIVLSLFIHSLALMAHVPSQSEEIVELKYRGSADYGKSWRRRVSYLIPLPKACTRSKLSEVLLEAQEDALKKCEKDGAVHCRIKMSENSTGRGDLKCIAFATAVGNITKQEFDRRKEEEESKKQAIAEAKKLAAEEAKQAKEEALKEQERKLYIHKELVSSQEQLDELISENFDQQIILHFTPDWDCGPCRAGTPTLEYISEITGVKIINVLPTDELAEEFNITGLPTYIFMQDGEIQESKVGLTTSKQFIELLK